MLSLLASPWRSAAFVMSLLLSGLGLAEPAGWRGDGTGQFPQAKPPSAWGPEQGVIWRTPLPARGNASPVLVGERLLFSAEPLTLLCLAANDGRILWQAEHDYLQLATPAEAPKIKEAMAQVGQIEQQRPAVQRKLGEVRRSLRGKPDDAELKEKEAALKTELAAVEAQLKPLAQYRLPMTHEANGYSSATPASDGQRVFALFGNGVASAHTLDGQRLWMRLLEQPTHEWGHCNSPVLAAGLVILQVGQLHALDPATGETKWKAPARQCWGTAAVTRIGDTEVLVTAEGSVIRASDGKVLARDLGRLEYNGPLIHDGIAYFIQHGGKAWKLGEIKDDKLTPTALWSTAPKKERYYSSPVLLDGLLYCINQQRVFSVLDAATGEVVKEMTLELGRGTVYPSIVRAGGHLLIGSESGVTLVVKPGRAPEVVSSHSVEPYRGTILPAGERLYLRGFKHAWCFGPTAAGQ